MRRYLGQHLPQSSACARAQIPPPASCEAAQPVQRLDLGDIQSTTGLASRNSREAGCELSEIHASQNVSPDVLLEHFMPSSCLVCSDSFTSSSDNVATTVQRADSVLNTAVLKEQIPVDIPIAILNLIEDKSLVTSAIALGDAEIQTTKESKNDLQQTITSLEINLGTDEKFIIRKKLEYLLEKYNIPEMDFLNEKQEKVISHQDDYKMLQEILCLSHGDLAEVLFEDSEKLQKKLIGDVDILLEKSTGSQHISLVLLQSTVQQQEAATEKQYILTIEKHSHKCEELNAQHQRLLDILEAEKEVLSEKIKEALLQQSQKHKEVLDKCLDEEKKRSKETLAAVAKAEKEVVQEAILKAVEEERRNMEKIHAEERKMWEAECDSRKEKIAQAVLEAMQEQRKHDQDIVREALMEEQKRSQKAVEEAVKRTREELVEYIKEQKRLDQVVRQRSLSSLELFLSCAQKQLSTLLKEELVTAEEKRE
ncbi:coiled-coil domain-containing protein 91 [Rhea pennata]|uniref:coiled-coil domain-containing protein 91 n=1 Tax=Rhea pennata TaxID=8795 RepID=UPI002E273DCA